MDAPALRVRALELCKASRVLERGEVDWLFRFVEVTKAQQRARAQDVIHAGQGFAVLVMVFADGTPLRTSVQFRQMTSGDAPDLRRHGRAGREFLLLRAHVKAMPYDRCHMAPFTMEPIALTHGKSTWHIYSAVTAFMGTLSSQGHHGISVHFYCFDRGLFSSLFAKLRSRHKLPYMQGNGGAHQTPGQVMAEASDWCVGVGCCLHDGQNALKWATRQHLPSYAADVSDLHIVVEAVRNSFADLMAFLGRHITANLGFDDTPFEESSVREFWLCLGVRGDYLDILCSLNLWWSGTELLVHSSWRDDPQLYEQVSKCILYLFQFRAFSDSRWATMGPSSRTLLAGLSVGLDSLVATIVRDRSTSNYYINGYAKFSPTLRHYVVVTSLASFVADAFLVGSLEDDRLALRCEELHEAMVEEIDWLLGLSVFTWLRMTNLAGGAVGPRELRTEVVLAGLTCLGFVSEKVFRVARSLPWSICRDIDGGLDALQALQAAPQDPTAQKIWFLLRVGVSRARLQDACRVLGECEWSTRCVEQGHGSIACIKKLHPECTGGVLAARAALHQQRAMFNASEGAKQVAKLEAQLQRQCRKQPEKITGRHVFLSDAFEALRSALPAGKSMTNAARIAVMQRHGAEYRSLPPQLRLKYDLKAQQMARDRRETVLGETCRLRAAADLAKARLEEVAASSHPRCELGECRYTASELSSMCQLLGEPRFQLSAVSASREKDLEAPVPPHASYQDLLSSCPVSAPNEQGDLSKPCWLGRFTALRDSFRQCALLAVVGGVQQAWLLLYASQNPQKVVFSPLRVVDCPAFTVSDCSAPSVLDALNRHYEHHFELEIGQFHTQKDLPSSVEDLSLLPDLLFLDARHVVSHADAMPLARALEGSDPACASDHPGPAQPNAIKKASNIDPGLLKSNPWLVGHLKRKETGQDVLLPLKSQGVEEESTTECEEEGLVSNAFLDLERRRNEWQLEHTIVLTGFEVYIRGGQKTHAQKGRSLDEFRGQASTPSSRDWCRRYGLQRTFGAALPRYGDALASQLCLEWCHRQQYHFDIYCTVNDEAYTYSETDWAGYAERPEFLEVVASLEEGSVGYTRALELSWIRPHRPVL